jgi:hypothetical protein
MEIRIMDRTELSRFFKTVQEKGEPLSMIYYSRSAKCSFSVKILDEKGQPIQKKHPGSGQVVFVGANPLYMEKMESFSPIVTTRSSKADALCFIKVESTSHGVFTPYQKEMVAVLEEMTGSGYVMTEATYKKVKNPEAYAQEQAFNKLRSEHLEKVEKAYETGKTETAKEFESEIEKLNRQLKEAEKQISQLTEPDKADKSKK